PSGSDEADPSSVTVLLPSTDWSGPAFATGAWLTWLMVTSVLALLTSEPSLTWSAKVATLLPVARGEGKGALAEVAFASVAAGPDCCTHWYVSGLLSGLELALPSSVTVTPSPTVWVAPAFATGAWPPQAAPLRPISLPKGRLARLVNAMSSIS